MDGKSSGAKRVLDRSSGGESEADGALPNANGSIAMERVQCTESGNGVSIKLPWEWAMKPRPALPLLPRTNRDNVVVTTCAQCGRSSWRDEIALWACRRSR